MNSAPIDVRTHANLRFAVGVTAAFVLCEALAWSPSFIAAALVAVLLANLPARPTMKVAFGLVIAMSVAAASSFVLASWFRETPTVLFGVVGLCMFLSFHAMLGGGPPLPSLLMLICLATIPVVTMVAPSAAGALPIALVRGMVVALVIVAAVHAIWPASAAPGAAPAMPPRTSPPLALALGATAVILPLMLVFLLFGLADVLPVMIASVMLVANFDPRRGRKHALGMIAGNGIGGMIGMLMHVVLLTMPNLFFLGGLLFLVLLAFGKRITAGGPSAAVALIACNAMLIIFGSSIAAGAGALSLWLTRLLQFTLAGAFAVAMMELAWHRIPLFDRSPGRPR